MLVGAFLLLTAVSASTTVSSCTIPAIRDALVEPPTDLVIFLTCAGTVIVDATMNVPDGVVFNATGKLTLVAAGNFPIFNLEGGAFIGGMTLKNGSGTNGGCITTSNTADSDSNIILSDLTFENCRATEKGGGLYLKTGTAYLIHSRFRGCSANEGGAFATAPGVRSIDTIACEFHNNTATGLGGGAVFLQNTTSTSGGAAFLNNRATGSSGGAVYTLNSHFTCNACQFQSNIANGPGGAVFVSGATTTISGAVSLVDTYFLNNSGVGKGAAVYACVRTNEEFTLLNGVVCDNQLLEPSGVGVGSAVHAECEGRVGVDSSSFSGNQPGSKQFTATSSTSLMFFFFTEVETIAAREVCDYYQNLTNYAPSDEPILPGEEAISAATGITINSIVVIMPSLVALVSLLGFVESLL